MQESTERVLFVHAHPDDESISTGGTIALLVARGAHVTVLTCTRGELGEVVDPTLAITSGDELAFTREKEIADAMRVLGVTDHRFLGTPAARWEEAVPRRYVDSGMQWGPSGAEPLDGIATTALVAAPFAEVAADIAMVVADVMPGAVISYNATGGYGHPDHIFAAETAARAAEVMGVPFWAIEPGEVGENGTAADDAATVAVDVSSVFATKRSALLAHRSQLVVGAQDFAGANGEREPITTVERFRRVVPGEASVDSSFAAQSIGVKIFTVLVALVFGAGSGLVLTAVHSVTVNVGDATIPWAAIGGLVATAALLAGLRIVFRSRVVAASATVGFIVMAAVLVNELSRESTVPGDLASYLWFCGVPIVALAVIVWPQGPRSAAGRIGRIPAVKGSSIQ
jgi:N-acetyl-1-D-myo-inositol-2-amino-2-deoxy-alpha-D-glucopyranoside deacetylase